MAGQHPLLMKVSGQLVKPILFSCVQLLLTNEHSLPNRIKMSSNPQWKKKFALQKTIKFAVSVLHCRAEARWTGPAMSPSPNAGWSVNSSVAWLGTVHMENCLHWVRGDGLFINRIRCLGGRQGETYRRVNRSDGFIEMHMVRRAERTEPLNHSLGMIIMTDLHFQLNDPKGLMVSIKAKLFLWLHWFACLSYLHFR